MLLSSGIVGEQHAACWRCSLHLGHSLMQCTSPQSPACITGPTQGCHTSNGLHLFLSSTQLQSSVTGITLVEDVLNILLTRSS